MCYVVAVVVCCGDLVNWWCVLERRKSERVSVVGDERKNNDVLCYDGVFAWMTRKEWRVSDGKSVIIVTLQKVVRVMTWWHIKGELDNSDRVIWPWKWVTCVNTWEEYKPVKMNKIITRIGRPTTECCDLLRCVATKRWVSILLFISFFSILFSLFNSFLHCFIYLYGFN